MNQPTDDGEQRAMPPRALARLWAINDELQLAIQSQGDPEHLAEDLPAVVRRVAQELPELEPGAEFGSLLVRLGQAIDRDVFAQEALLTAWDRQRAWTLAQLYAAAQPFTDDRDEEWSNTEAIRQSLGLSRQGARNLALVAQRLFALFSDTLDQLRAGQISQGHVWALIEATKDLDDELAGKVEQLTYQDAPHQTIAEYRRALDRARLEVDPEAGERRHEEKVLRRKVGKWTGRDGVGRMLAELPGEDLAAAFDALKAKAAAIRQPDDPRAQGALLADALTECITGVPAAHDPRRRPDTPATTDDWPEDPPAAEDDPSNGGGGPGGDGPGDGSPGGGEGDPSGGGEGGPNGGGEGGPNGGDDARPAPPAADKPEAQPAAPAAVGPSGAVEVHVVIPRSLVLGGPTARVADVIPLANRKTRRSKRRKAKQSGSRRGRVLTSRSVAVVGLETFMGRAKKPVELSGFGWVPSSVVHRLTQGNVVIRRLVIDENGRLLDAELTMPLPAGELPSEAIEEALLRAPYRDSPLDYGATVYRMPAELERFIVLRDRTCTIPGCGQPAWRCDCDHAVPYPIGSTSERNCGSLCRWHHRLKTHAQWDLKRLDDGSVLWTSPGGHLRRRPAFSYNRYIS